MKVFNAARAFEEAPNLKVCLIGRTGTGKTTWSARSPSPLVILIEQQGWQSIAVTQRTMVDDNWPIEKTTVVVESWQEFVSVWQSVLSATIEQSSRGSVATATIAGEPRQFQTVVLDGITRLGQMLHRRMAGKNIRPENIMNPDDRPTLSTPQWGRMIDIIQNVLDDVGKLPINCIVTGIAEDETILSGEDRTQIAKLHIRPRSISGIVGQYFNAVGFATKIGDDFVIVWKTDARFPSKPFAGFPGVVSADVTLGSYLLMLNDSESNTPHNNTDAADLVVSYSTPTEEE